jgi:replicative DNA helicase
MSVDASPAVADPALDLAMATALGVVLEHPEQAGDVFAAVRIEDFTWPYLPVAEAIHGLRLNRTEISPLAVIDEMTRRGSIGRVGGPAEVHRIAGFGFGSADYSVQVIARHARLRRLDATALRLHQLAAQKDADPGSIARSASEELQAVVDGIEAEGDITTPSLGEFLTTEDAPYDWVIPGLLERGDRLVLTGSEGLGKSVLNRQLAVAAASGVHPFTHEPIVPMRVLYVDCENGPGKLRRALRGLATVGTRNGTDPSRNMFLEAIPEGLDLTRPEDEAWLVRRVSALQPDLLLVGPIYRLHAANPNDEEPARKVTRVLDRCRAASNCALVTEAHAGHGGYGHERPIRPTGSSLWLRWPEFGYGLRAADGFDPETNRTVEFVAWRGDREERQWPRRLTSGGIWPWQIDRFTNSFTEGPPSYLKD